MKTIIGREATNKVVFTAGFIGILLTAVTCAPKPANAAEVTSGADVLTVTGTDSDEQISVQVYDGWTEFTLEPGETREFNSIGVPPEVTDAPWAVWTDGRVEAFGYLDHDPVGQLELTAVGASRFQPWFADIARSVHRDNIVWLAEQRITHGCTPTRYCPGDSTTRGQMAKFIDLAGGFDDGYSDGGLPFDDIASSVFVEHIVELGNLGVIDALEGESFAPGVDITRRTMVRWLEQAGACPYLIYPEPVFDDVPVDDPDRGYIEGCFDAGITYGYSDNLFGPDDPVTRGQMASFLKRAFG